MFRQDTIAAISTPPGEGGIAIIRISGPAALPIAARLFRSPDRAGVEAYRGYTVHYGAFVDPRGTVVDDGLLTVFRAPRSYTGEDTVELSCHGGRAATTGVLALALAVGARLADPGEFTQRAFLNGKIDLAQAEAVGDMIRARTESARRVARRQLDGALSHAVLALKEELIGILAAIEVTIDFSDEVGELDYEAVLARLQSAIQRTEELLATADRGRILREGLRVAIVGAPNVGKSSLLNRLLGVERAIVTPIAGTTRDLLEETAGIGGIPVVLTDTAGIRATEDMVERIGVERAHQAADAADIVLTVLDAAQEVDADTPGAHPPIGSDAPRVYALNKCDLIAPDQVRPLVDRIRSAVGATVQAVSAHTGAGIDALERALLSAAQAGGGANDIADSVVVANVRHTAALQQAQRSLNEAQQTAFDRMPGDFIAIDVRGALDALGQITGETVNEEIIHRIFHDFCVGK